MTDTMKRGDSLRVGDELRSSNGRHSLVMQSDGNLVLYQPSGPVWETQTYKLPAALRPTRLDFQQDQNIVLYNQFNYVGWSPNIYGKGGDRLTIQDDGNVAVFTSADVPVWETYTALPASQVMQEITHHEEAEVGWSKKMTTDAKLFRNGTLLVTTTCACGAPFTGFRGTVLVVAIDAQSRVIWASQTLQCQTACGLFDLSCASTSTTQFQEKWPDLIGQLTVRLDVFQADNVIYDRMRIAIREAIETIQEIKAAADQWV